MTDPRRESAGSQPPLPEICLFLDCCPLLRYFIELERRTPRGPKILVDAKGTQACLDSMVRRVLGMSDASGGLLPLAVSDRSGRRRERVMAAVDSLLFGLDDRKDLRYLIVWNVAGSNTVECEASSDWPPESQKQYLHFCLKRSFTGILSPPPPPVDAEAPPPRPATPAVPAERNPGRLAKNSTPSWDDWDPSRGPDSSRADKARADAAFGESALQEAQALACGWSARRLIAECGVLGRLPDGEIRAAAGISPDVLATFERQFFDVRPHLNQRTWVYLYAIRDPDPLVATVRRLSYGGGPGFVRALIPELPVLFGPGASDEQSPDPHGLASQIRRIAAIEASPVSDADLCAWHRLERMPSRRRARKRRDKTQAAMQHIWSQIPGLRFPEVFGVERDAESA